MCFFNVSFFVYGNLCPLLCTVHLNQATHCLAVDIATVITLAYMLNMLFEHAIFI